MPIFTTDLETTIIREIEAMGRWLSIKPIIFGGAAGVSGGSTSRPIQGQLPQSKVTFDTSEGWGDIIPTGIGVSGSSLVHNLNRIRGGHSLVSNGILQRHLASGVSKLVVTDSDGPPIIDVAKIIFSGGTVYPYELDSRIAIVSAITGSGGGSGTVQGTGANTQVAFWTNIDTIAGDPGFTYNSTTDTLSIGAFIDAVADDTAGGFRAGIYNDVLWYYDVANDSWRTPDKVIIDLTLKINEVLGVGVNPASNIAIYAFRSGSVDPLGLYGIFTQVTASGTYASGDVIALQATAGTSDTSITLATLTGIRITVSKESSDTVTIARGLFIDNVSDGATNYAIYTNAGLIRFGDAVSVISGKFINVLTDGSTGGFRAGATSDVLWYRFGPDTWGTPDGIIVGALSTFNTGVNVASGYSFTAATDGSGGGFKAGLLADVLWYRDAADVWRTPDTVVIDSKLYLGTTGFAAPFNVGGFSVYNKGPYIFIDESLDAGFTHVAVSNSVDDNPYIAGWRARGTVYTSPSATQSGDTLFRVTGRGYGASGWNPASRARIDLIANQNFTDSAHGTRIEFYTTPNDSTTIALVAKLTDVGQFQLPVTGSTGGILIGGDALIYRTSADILRTPDSIQIDSKLGIGVAPSYYFDALIASGANRDVARMGISGVSSGFLINYIHSSTSFTYVFYDGTVTIQAGANTGILDIQGGSGGGANVAHVAFTRIGSGELARIETLRVGANDAGDLLFYTKASGGALTERARITSAGRAKFDGDGTRVFELPADATDPTGGGGAAAGRIPVLIGGVTKYLAYY